MTSAAPRQNHREETERRLPFFLSTVCLAVGIVFSSPLAVWTPSLILAAAILSVSFFITDRITCASWIIQFRGGKTMLGLSVLLAALATGIMLGPRAEQSQSVETSVASPLAEYMNRTFSYRLARFSRAVILAERTAIDDIDTRNYRRTGLTHLLAISGLNVAIMAGIFWALSGLAGKGSIREFTAAATTMIYVVGIGAPASALRAGIMSAAVFLARGMGRASQSLNILFGAAFVTLLFSPASLHDIGFQLSYAAAYGIILWTRPVERFLLRRPRLLWKLVAGTTAAQAATAPLMIWHFGVIAPISFLANLAVVPIFGVLFPLILAGLCRIPFAAISADYLLAAMTTIIAGFSELPGTAYTVARPSVAMMSSLAGFASMPLIGNARGRRAVMIVSASAMILAFSIDQHGPDSGVYVAAEPQGGMAVIWLHDHVAPQIIDDGLSAQSWQSTLSQLDITRIDRLAATSPRILEYSGNRALVEICPIASMEVPKSWQADLDFKPRLDEIRASGVNVSYRAEKVPALTLNDETVTLGAPDRADSKTISIFRYGRNALKIWKNSGDREPLDDSVHNHPAVQNDEFLLRF